MSAPARQTCAQCGAAAGADADTITLPVCGACHKVAYCDRACQKAHYKTHTAACRATTTLHLPPQFARADALACLRDAMPAYEWLDGSDTMRLEHVPSMVANLEAHRTRVVIVVRERRADRVTPSDAFFRAYGVIEDAVRLSSALLLFFRGEFHHMPHMELNELVPLVQRKLRAADASHGCDACASDGVHTCPHCKHQWRAQALVE
jgi:hypothetical protein